MQLLRRLRSYWFLTISRIIELSIYSWSPWATSWEQRLMLAKRLQECVPDAEVQLRQELPQEWKVDALPLHQRTQINKEACEGTNSISYLSKASTMKLAPCTSCKGVELDAYFIQHQGVMHVRCLTCGQEWVE